MPSRRRRSSCWRNFCLISGLSPEVRGAAAALSLAWPEEFPSEIAFSSASLPRATATVGGGGGGGEGGSEESRRRRLLVLS